jgi:hypothetical protein
MFPSFWGRIHHAHGLLNSELAQVSNLLIPLDSEELDAEARRYLAKLEESMTPEQRGQVAGYDQKKALENLRQFVYQQRLGHVQVES